MSNVHNDTEHSGDRSNRKIAPISLFYAIFCGDVLNSYALPGIYPYTLRQTRDLRRVKGVNKVVTEIKFPRSAFPYCLGLIDNDFFASIQAFVKK